MALLLGSDYTKGIAGVGPVLALEILAEFRSSDDDGQNDGSATLKRFKKWVMEEQKIQLANTARKDALRKRKVRHSDECSNIAGAVKHAPSAVKQRLRKMIRSHRLILPDNFPSEVVRRAYMAPRVDSSSEPFSWSRPDIDAIKRYSRRAHMVSRTGHMYGF